MWDTAGQPEYSSMRPLSYRSTDVFLVCISVVDKVTADAVTSYWLPEIKQFIDTNTVVVVVGTKADLRRSANIDEVRKVRTTN